MSFKPMLAASEAPDLDAVEKMFPYWLQPKFDGFRCTVLPKLGAVSRTLKAIPNRYVRAMMDEGFCHEHIDGEIVTYTDGVVDPLNVVNSKLSKVEGRPDFKFHMFDNVQFPDLPYHARYDMIPERTHVGIRVEKIVITSLPQLMREEDKLVRAKWEGGILRHPDGLYKHNRATLKEGTLLKLKRFYDHEAEVIGFEELMINENEQKRDERGYAKRSSSKAGKVPGGTLGALVCRWTPPDFAPGYDEWFAKGDHSPVCFKIGGGWTDAERQEIWDRRDTYMGRYHTFKFQRIGEHGRPLLPIGKAWRSRAEMEDII